jgi:hypothetical protein
MTKLPFTLAELLTPEPLPGPPDPAVYTRVTRPVETGLPLRIDLGADLALVLIAPTGVATAWRDADPRAIVSSSDDEHAPFDPAGLATAPTAPAGRVPLRLVLLSEGRPLAAVPLRLGRALLPDTGADDRGTLAQIVVLSWEIHAGTLRGAGDVGSLLDLAWRRADHSSDAFSPPAPHPHVLERYAPVGFYGGAMGHAGWVGAH